MSVEDVNVLDLPEWEKNQEGTHEVIVVADGQVIGGGVVVRPKPDPGSSKVPPTLIMACWAVDDLTADHWLPLVTKGLAAVFYSEHVGLANAIRKQIEHTAAVWEQALIEQMKRSDEILASAIHSQRAAALDQGRQEGTATVVGLMLDHIEKTAVQRVIDHMPQTASARPRPRG